MLFFVMLVVLIVGLLSYAGFYVVSHGFSLWSSSNVFGHYSTYRSLVLQQHRHLKRFRYSRNKKLLKSPKKFQRQALPFHLQWSKEKFHNGFGTNTVNIKDYVSVEIRIPSHIQNLRPWKLLCRCHTNRCVTQNIHPPLTQRFQKILFTCISTV